MRWGGAFAPNAGRPASMTRATEPRFTVPQAGANPWTLTGGKCTLQMRCAPLSRRPPRHSRGYRNQVPTLWHAYCSEAHRAQTRAPRASLNWRRPLWLYLPKACILSSHQSAASPSAPALADWSLVCESQNPATGLFAMSSGTATLRPFSWRGWQTRAYVMLLSGTTLPPSTAALGAEQWISSLRDIRVSPSRPPDGNSRKKILDTSGRTSGVSSRRRDQNASSSKTSPVMSTEGFARSPETYRRWALLLKRACSQRLKSALRTGGFAFSCWPTPTTSLNCNRSELRVNSAGILWVPAKDQRGNQVAVGTVAFNWTVFRRLAVALGWKAGPMPTFPFSRPVLATIKPGSGSSPDDLTLNPAFLEWLMGWPIGWTDTTRSVTAFAPWLQHSRGALSKLVSSPLQPPENGSLKGDI